MKNQTEFLFFVKKLNKNKNEKGFSHFYTFNIKLKYDWMNDTQNVLVIYL